MAGDEMYKHVLKERAKAEKEVARLEKELAKMKLTVKAMKKSQNQTSHRTSN